MSCLSKNLSILLYITFSSIFEKHDNTVIGLWFESLSLSFASYTGLINNAMNLKRIRNYSCNKRQIEDVCQWFYNVAGYVPDYL